MITVFLHTFNEKYDKKTSNTMPLALSGNASRGSVLR